MQLGYSLVLRVSNVDIELGGGERYWRTNSQDCRVSIGDLRIEEESRSIGPGLWYEALLDIPTESSILY